MKQKIVLFLFFIVCVTTLIAEEILPVVADQTISRFWVTVRASSPEERTEITRLGMPIDEVDDTSVSGIASQEIIDQLLDQHFSVCSCESLETQCKKLALTGKPFLTYNSTVKKIQKLAAKYPDIVSYFSAGKSVQGRELFVIRINATEKGSSQSSRPGILLIGNHHAREHITAEFCIKCAKYIATHVNDPALRQFIGDRDIFIMPIANPDGVDYDLSTFPYKFHRKNMRPFANHVLGVDLNRNYDFDWGGIGASKRQNNESYCGESPFSEPETQAIRTLVESHTNIRILISYHSYGKLILYPWGYTRNQVGNGNDLQSYLTLIKGMMARLPDYTAMQASAMYIVSGEAADWSYGINNILALTIEMMPRAPHGASGFYPTDRKEIEGDIQNNINAALFAIEFANNRT